MTSWWWVRHGPTHRRDLNGWNNVPADLSDKGALDRLAEFLPSNAPVVSSDLSRAVATADAVQRERARLPHDPALREINFGAWEGRCFGEIEKENPQLTRRYWEQPGDIRPPGGESWNDLRARVDHTVDARVRQVGDIIAVAHFGTILSQVQRAIGCSAIKVLGHKIDPLSVTRLDWDGEHWFVGEINRIPG